MSRIRIRHPDLPPALQTWLLVDAHGLPRYWATVWQSLKQGGLASGTVGLRLAAIDRLYASVAEQAGQDCLDQLLAHRDVDRLLTALEGFYSVLRNEAARNGTNTDKQWQAAVEFVRCMLTGLGLADRAIGVLDAGLTRLDSLYAALTPGRGTKRARVRALPASVVENLYEIADPASLKNPFRTEAAKWRNYALLLMLLHQGLRRGEALILPCNAIKDGCDYETGERRTWLDVSPSPWGQDEDPRYLVPSLKTVLSQRQIPISEDIVEIVDHYTTNFRGKQDHPFLFASRWKRPLAIPSLNSVLKVLSESLSPGAVRDLNDRNSVNAVSPHDLRHTCAVVRLSEFVSSGMEMKLALQNLRTFFGWTRESEMPLHYAEAFFEDRLKDVWQRKQDDRVVMLRHLQRIEQNAGVLSENLSI